MGIERKIWRMLFGRVRETKFVPEPDSDSIRVFNWNTEHTCLPAKVGIPADVEELRAAIRSAVANGQQVRAVGSLHSISAAPMVADGGVIISTERLNRTGPIENGTMRLQAGVTMRQACQALKSAGKQLNCLPLTDQFHVGAICGTQFHDSIPFNSDVVEIKYVASDGSLGVVNDDQELFYWRNSHGLFGIVYELSVRVTDAKPIHLVPDHLPMSDFVATLHNVPSHCRRIGGLYDPYCDDILVCNDWYGNPADMAGTRSFRNRIRQQIWHHLGPIYGFITPSISPGTKRLQARICHRLLGGGFAVHPGDRPMSIRNWGPATICQLALPVRALAGFLPEFRALCLRYRDQYAWQVAQLVVMVLVFRDQQAPFSLSYEEDMLAFDVMHSPFDDPVWTDFRDEYLDMAIDKHSARAHLSKTSGPVTPDQALGYFRHEHIEEFKKQIDPKLLNPYFSRLFGLSAEPIDRAEPDAGSLKETVHQEQNS